MEVIFLGTGTSHGIPVIGCDCPVCRSDDPKNKRTRSSVYIIKGALRIIIDMTPEFRIQMLRENLCSADAVLITHTHADHLHGLDDIRPLTKEKPIPVYSTTPVIDTIYSRFDYIFKATQVGGGKPHIELHREDAPFTIMDPDGISTTVIPIPMKHGQMDTTGYRIDDFAYLTDCNYVPESSFQLLKGIKVAVIDGLRFRKHTTHFTIEEAIETARKIKAETTYLIHMCHDIDHDKVSEQLPDGIKLSYDGLRINF
ncbi:MAG: MBL fold metallo-hydrolase [Spirochaetia bacterium]|nr:MBL fold metallo-hydrolase [Spirochaetia bacterium]